MLILVLLLACCAPATSATDDRAPGEPAGRWATVLGRLDDVRERAYVRGDPALLGRVYVRGSPLRRADARLLRAYERRGLELDAVPLRLRDVELVSLTDRRVRLRVLDQLGAVRVRSPGGPWRALPTDQPTKRIITLQRTSDGWRVAAISRVAG